MKNMMEVPTESVVGNGYERMDADSIGIGNMVKSADLEQLRQVVTEKVVFGKRPNKNKMLALVTCIQWH